jgi:sodium transport system permease protein
MILIPMLLMPVMIIGMFKFIQSQSAKQSQQTLKVAIAGADYAPQLADAVRGQKNFEITQVDTDPKQAVADEKIDAAIIIPEDFQAKIENEEPVQLNFISKSTNLKTSNAYLAILSTVSDFNKKLLQERFTDQHINPSVLSNVTLAQEDAATSKETGGFVLGFLIPLFIVMWAIVGGQYTAIDVSAGEKERKTLEALLLTPVKRVDIVLGKFLAVSTVAVVSIITAISSLYFSFVYAGKMGVPIEANMNTGASMPVAAGLGALNFSVEPQAVLILFVISLFLVLMFSAIILSISIFAKSFKEAQSYISPAYIIVILPVVLVNAVPGFQPTLMYFAVPAVNAILLFKELLMGTYDWAHILLTLISLAIYSAAAIFIASKIYSRESVLFND